MAPAARRHLLLYQDHSSCRKVVHRTIHICGKDCGTSTGNNPSAHHREPSSPPWRTEEVDHAPKVKAGEIDLDLDSVKSTRELTVWKSRGRSIHREIPGEISFFQSLPRGSNWSNRAIRRWLSFLELSAFFALQCHRCHNLGLRTSPPDFDIVQRGFVTCHDSHFYPFFVMEEGLINPRFEGEASSRLPSSHADPGRRGIVKSRRLKGRERLAA